MRRRRAGIKSEWYDIYPVQFQFVFGSDQGNESVFLVDVAGGKGHDIPSLKASLPLIPGRLILQDFTADCVRTFHIWMVPRRIPHDVFSEQPVRG